MKTLILTFSFLAFAFLTMSETEAQTTTTSETANNQILLNNAKLEREALEKKQGPQPVQEMRVLGTQKNINSASTNLTDQDKQLSENYIHQGKANQIITEQCAGDMRAVCSGNEGKHKFMGMDPNMVKALSQAYTMIGMMAGDSMGAISKGEGALKKETEAASKDLKPGEKPEAVDKKANDYCKYIPTVTEGLATATQMAASKELSGEQYGNGDTSQKDSLLKAAKSHDSRAKMAQIQAAGWWGGAACYGVNAATGNFATDKNLILKLGAASLLGAFYQNEVAANKEYAEKTRKIANSLPGKGDCNPITDKLCYCSQPSTENDPTYCLPTLHKKALAQNSYRVACTDDKMKLDPQCTCENTNSCFDSALERQSQGVLELGGIGFSNSPFTGIRSLARGELVGGTINGQSFQRTAAIAKKALQEVSSKIPLSGPISAEQKKLIDAMMSKGLPSNVATLMAQNPPSAQATNSAMAKFNGAASGTLESASTTGGGSRGSNILDFSGGNGLGTGGAKAKDDGGNDDLLAKLKGSTGAKGAINPKILHFAEKAQNMANQAGQIRKDEGAQLFDIISMRYQTSGRRLLQVDTNNN